MRRNLFLYIALLIIPFINAYSLEGIQLVSSGANELVLSYKPNFHGFTKVIGENGEELLIPKINGTILNIEQFGNYKKLGSNALLSVPAPDSYEIIDIKIIKSKQYKAKLAPVETPDTDNAPNSILRIDNNKYYQGYQHEWAKISYSGISQNRYLAKLEIYAYEFLPEQNIINVPEEIIIKIRYNSTGSAPKNFNPIYAKNILNAGTQSDYIIPQTNTKLTKTRNTLQFDSQSQWAKIAINEDGLYKITASQLEGLGFNIPKENVNTIKIFGTSGEELSEKVSDAYKYAMNEQDIIVNTNTDGTLKEVLFFGSGTSGFKYKYKEKTFAHFKNAYSNKNYYLLTFGGENGHRAEPVTEPSGEPTYFPTTYKQHISLDEDLSNPYPNGGGRTWFGQSFISLQFVNQLYNLDKSGKIDYRFAFGQKSFDNSRIYCYENSNSLGNVFVQNSNGYYTFAGMGMAKFSILAEKISSDDRSRLSFEYKPNTGDFSATAYFDYYEIHYPRYFVPINNEITFDIDSTTLKKNVIAEYSINGFTDKIYGFDITNKNSPQLLPNNSSTGGLFKFRDKIDSNEVYKQYFVSAVMKTPSIETMSFTDVMGETKGADIIFVYNKSMSETAKKYKEYRESKTGFTVYLANTDDIYTEFASGKADPTAIRDMIAWAYKNWETKPRFVVLWGDAHYDFRNIESKAVNFVPTYQVLGDSTRASEISNYATDDYFGNIEGDDSVFDIAVGRLPVDNLESSNIVLQKIIDYEQNPDKGAWQTQMILLADDSNAEDGRQDDAIYVTGTETMIDVSVPDYMLTNKMYHPIYPTERLSANERRKPALNKAWTTEVNTNGAVILNWMGHGNPRVWSHEEVLDRDITLPALINSKKLFFCVAGTCEYGRYDDPNIRSGAEDMVISKTGGAIGVIAASRISYQDRNAKLMDDFYGYLFEYDVTTGEYPTFGESLQYTKMLLHDENDKKYVLLGDPSVRPNFPKYNISIDSLAGCKITNNDSILELKALQKVRITGRVTNPADNSLYSSFNGTGIITMFDGDDNAAVTDDDNRTYKFLAYGGALNKSSYSVTNGTFAIEFIIPKDISYSTKTGRIFLSAFENESLISAKGFYNKFIINGTEDNPDQDTKGPEVGLFLDSREFISGDVVSSAPLLIADLYDESGINTTGMGIGHKIEVWVDDNPLSIDLTKKFTTSFEDSRRGSIEDILSGLKPGTHKIKIRVWDIYNNFATAQTEFIIQNPDAPAEIFDILNYPNPFAESTTIKFDHTAVPPYNVEIAIFNQIGALVRTLKETETELRTSEVPWDAKDERGNTLPSGPYYFRIILQEKNKISTSYGNMYMIK
ncbi:MAG: type IX secretion system sortase PorU [bacterium]